MLSKFGVMLSISRDWKWWFDASFLVWSMKTDMQGLTIAIFRQKLNFFSEKFLVYLGVIEDSSFW